MGPAYDGQMYLNVQQATRGLQQLVLQVGDTGCELSCPAGPGSSQQLCESSILYPVQDSGCDNATEGSCNGNSTGATYMHPKQQTCDAGDVQSTRIKEKLPMESLCLEGLWSDGLSWLGWSSWAAAAVLH